MFTWVEVDKKAIEYNLKQFRKVVGPKTLLMPTVKSNAYGHGIVEVAKICDRSLAVDRICVVNLDEALQLLKTRIKKRIMILGFYELDESKLKRAIKAGVIFPIYRLDQAEYLNRVGERAHKKAVIHIKIDTGVTRLGIAPHEAVAFVTKIKTFDNLLIEGIFSHYASSEEDKLYTEHQLRAFKNTIKNLEAVGVNTQLKHLTCSAASILHPRSHFNAVRLGLGLYGLYPDDLTRKKIKLLPALSWHTQIIQLKTVPPGTKVSYGGTFTTKHTTKLAVLPVGYDDGYDRQMGNRAHVLIRGKKCTIRGRICMNMCIADVTALKNVKTGDRATLIGRQIETSVSADHLAKWAGTINYEIVDRINPLLPRLVI